MLGDARESYFQELYKRLAHYRYWDAEEWWEILDCYRLRIE